MREMKLRSKENSTPSPDENGAFQAGGVSLRDQQAALLSR